MAGCVILAFFRRAITLREPSGARDEGADLLFVISDLNAVVVNDDRTLQNGWVLLDERDKFRDLHRIEIDILLLNDFGTRGDDVVGAVLRLGNHLHEVFGRKERAENILLDEGDFIILEPLLDFAAGGA